MLDPVGSCWWSVGVVIAAGSAVAVAVVDFVAGSVAAVAGVVAVAVDHQSEFAQTTVGPDCHI